MTVCWFGIYSTDYPRNYILLNGLKEEGVHVVHCGVDAQERFRYFKLIYKFLTLKESYDVVYVAFPAQSAVPIAKLLTRKRVVMDAFYSMFDSIVHDRKECGPYHPKALKMRFLDWLSALMADQMIVDTEEHKKYWATWRFVRKDKICVVPIGSDTAYFFPTAPQPHEGFLVQYHGSYIPLQGLDVVIRAVELLQDEPGIRFRFIGSGQEYKKIYGYATEHRLERIEFIERIPFQDVNAYLNEADVILGIFGETDKADRVIPNKIFEGLAVGKALISKDTPAIREALNEKDLILIPRDAEKLADAIRLLHRDPALREAYAKTGYATFLAHLSQRPIARQWRRCVIVHNRAHQ